jgi:hypothetical protein
MVGKHIKGTLEYTIGDIDLEIDYKYYYSEGDRDTPSAYDIEYDEVKINGVHRNIYKEFLTYLLFYDEIEREIVDIASEEYYYSNR